MRAQDLLRPALEADAPALVDVWADVLRRANREQQLEDVRQVIDRVAVLPGERLTVAEVDGAVVGAVHLRATTLSPINLDPVVQAISPHVLPEYRRHGIGTLLVEAAVAFAEELGINHVATAVSAGARDSNRFMARLALGPAATLDSAPRRLLPAPKPERNSPAHSGLRPRPVRAHSTRAAPCR